MINQDQYLVSVCDAQLYDKQSDKLVLNAKTLINSALETSVQEMLIKGGFSNKLQYIFNYEKELSVTLEDCRWDETYLAINNGELIQSGAKDIYITENITLSGDAGVVTETPVGNIYVVKADKSIVTITPTGKNFTVTGGGDTNVEVTYMYNETVDQIDITTDGFPKAYRLVLKGKLFQKASGQSQTGELQIIVENFKADGSFTLDFTADGASTSALNGRALEFSEAGKSLYAKCFIVPLGDVEALQLTQIAATPSFVEMADAQTQQISIIGIQSGMKGNVSISPADCTFTSDTVATAGVNSNGLITATDVDGTAIITVTHTASGFVDNVVVEVVN